jgi:GNAT superfamily N-acetyltransferase
LPDAVRAAEAWYAERGLRPVFSLFGPEGFAVNDDVLGALLGARGYTDVNRSVVMTAAVASLVSATRRPPSGEGDEGVPAVAVREGRTPWPQWWAASDERRRGSRDLAQAVMAGSPEQVLLAAEVDGRTVATARVAFAHAWAGVFGLHVLPGSRRLGVATALVGAAAAQAQARGTASMYLQVERANAGAVALYRRLGCATHHEYVYLAAPEPPTA